MNAPKSVLLLLIALWALPGAGRGAQGSSAPTDAQLIRLQGTLNVAWFDPPQDSDLPSGQRVSLAGEEDGRLWDLVLTPEQCQAAGGLPALNGARVAVEGRRVAGRLAAMQVARLERLEEPGGQRGVYGSQPYIWLLFRFSDISTIPEPVSYFEGQALGPYPSLDSFWREVSFNNINLLGSDVVGWLTLPHPRSYYIYDVNPDDPGDEIDTDRLLPDVFALAEPYVYFPSFVGMHLCFNGELDGYAWGGSGYFTLDGVSRVWGITYLPPWGFQNQSVVAHEGGHALGLPHSSGQYGAVYDSDWDVMSHSCGSCLHDDPVYGSLGYHTCSYHKDLLGWIHPLHTYVMPTTPAVASVWVNDLAVVPPAGRYLMLKMPYTFNPANFLTVERRRFTGYDENVAGESVVLHDVVPSRDIPAQVIDADMNGNPNDAGAMWEPGESFWVSGTNLAILMTVEEKDASGSRITITNAASLDSYVNLYNVGYEDGTSAHPWNTAFEGCGAVYPTGVVHFTPANYPEAVNVLKNCTLSRWGTSGVVTIGQ